MLVRWQLANAGATAFIPCQWDVFMLPVAISARLVGVWRSGFAW